jgi:hypothetical protein
MPTVRAPAGWIRAAGACEWIQAVNNFGITVGYPSWQAAIRTGYTPKRVVLFSRSTVFADTNNYGTGNDPRAWQEQKYDIEPGCDLVMSINTVAKSTGATTANFQMRVVVDGEERAIADPGHPLSAQITLKKGKRSILFQWKKNGGPGAIQLNFLTWARPLSITQI